MRFSMRLGPSIFLSFALSTVSLSQVYAYRNSSYVDAVFRNVPIRDAVEQLAKDHARIIWDPSIKGTSNATFRFLPFDSCLANILAQVHATYDVDNSGAYNVRPSVESDKNRKITASFKGASFRQAMSKLVAGRASAIIFDRYNSNVYQAFKNADIDAAIHSLCTQVGAKYTKIFDVYLVSKQARQTRNEKFLSDMLGHSPVAFHFIDMPADEAVRLILKGDASRQQLVDPSINDLITADVEFDSIKGAICWIANEVHGQYVPDAGGYILRPKKAITATPVSINFEKDTDARDALRALFRHVYVNYSIAPEVQGLVRGQFSGPFDDVLSEILDQLGSSFFVESHVYEIVHTADFSAALSAGSPKQSSPSTAGFIPPGITSGSDFGGGSPFWQSIPVPTKQTPLENMLVTMSFGETSIRTAIHRLFDGRGSAVVFPEVNGLVSGNLRQKPFEQVLQAICKQCDATYRIEGGIYEIVNRDNREAPATSPPDPDASISLDLNQQTIKSAMDTILTIGGHHSGVEVDPAITQTISGSARFETIEQALSWIADTVNAEIRLTKGRYHVVRKGPPNLSFSLDQKDIREVLKTIFKTRENVRYTIAPEVQGAIVGTFSGTFDDILSAVLQKVNARFRWDDNICVIERQP